MKTYSSTYTPAAVIALCAIRKVNVTAMEQAIDATLTGLKTTSEFTGLQSIKGEKGEHNAVMESIARMPQGTVKNALLYFGNVHKASKAAKKCDGVLTLSDFPASLGEWFTSFKVTATKAPKAPKAPKVDAAPAVTVPAVS